MSRSGRVLLSSEGVDAEVLQVTLPAGLTRDEPAPTSPLGPAPATRAPSDPAAEPDPGPRSAGDWGWVGLAAVGVAAFGYLSLRGSRRPSRCRR